MAKISINKLTFKLLVDSDELSKLDCTELDGTDPLEVNDFIHKHAKTAHNAKLTAVYVVRYNRKIISCFTVSMFVIKARRLSESEQIKSSPINSYPAILLGQMCVDKKYRSRDIGKHMCTFALGIASNVSKRVGCMCLVLHTNEEKSKYYEEKCGFTQAKINPEDRTIWMYRRII